MWYHRAIGILQSSGSHDKCWSGCRGTVTPNTFGALAKGTAALKNNLVTSYMAEHRLMNCAAILGLNNITAKKTGNDSNPFVPVKAMWIPCVYSAECDLAIRWDELEVQAMMRTNLKHITQIQEVMKTEKRSVVSNRWHLCLNHSFYP